MSAAAAEGADGPRLVIVMPAYNAARTLQRTYADIPHRLVDKIILVDDVSADETVEIASQLGLVVIIHPQNRGYGGNQKTCYDAALAAGGLAIGEIAVPTRYFEEASSVGFKRSVVYGLSTLRVVLRFLLHRARVRRSPKLTSRRSRSRQ